MSKFKDRLNAFKEECGRLQILSEISSSLWELETELYEMYGVSTFLDFANFDVRLFPYHPALFPLRDFVYTFSSDISCDSNDERRLPSLVYEPKRRAGREIELQVPGYCPCSAFAVMKSLVPLHRVSDFRNLFYRDNPLILSEHQPQSSCFLFLDQWSGEIIVDEWIKGLQPSIPEAMCSNSPYGPENINPNERFDILSRVLKHAISPFQRDHRLARAVLLLMTEYKCLNDDENLRLLLLILSSDRQFCNSNCHQDYVQEHGVPDIEAEDHSDDFPLHYCDDLLHFRSSVRLLLAYGMHFLSDKAVTIIMGFVNAQIDPYSSSKIGGVIPTDDWVEEVDGPPLIKELIGALHSHGSLSKNRIIHFFRLMHTQESPIHVDFHRDIEYISNSYENCVRCLVYIGEAFILRVQPSNVLAMLGGLVVKALVMLLNSGFLSADLFFRSEYLAFHSGSVHTKRKFPTLLSITRYSDMITMASTMSETRLDETQNLLSCSDPHTLKENSVIEKLFLSPVSKDIVTVVRGLFLRQLVDMTTSCCGYGDFLVWCKEPISVHDKLLYSNDCNLPLSDEDILTGHWGVCEEGIELERVEILARHDFSLLLLSQAWNKAWSVMSHSSFSHSFQKSMMAFSLCASRKRIPADLFTSVFECIPRSWFPDDTNNCWRMKCQLSQLYDDLRGIARVNKFSATCPNCFIACACSAKHASDLMFKEGHKRNCGLGPLRKFGKVEDAFCKIISTVTISTPPCEEDDDSSWESIDTDQEERNDVLDDKTRRMVSFFSKDYKTLSEDSEFDNFLRLRDGDY